MGARYVTVLSTVLNPEESNGSLAFSHIDFGGDGGWTTWTPLSMHCLDIFNILQRKVIITICWHCLKLRDFNKNFEKTGRVL